MSSKTKTLVVLGHRSGCGTVGRSYCRTLKHQEELELQKKQFLARIRGDNEV